MNTNEVWQFDVDDSEDVPVVPLWHEHNVAVANRDLVGFELLPNARIPSLARVAKAE